jgi:hypothetical protein
MPTSTFDTLMSTVAIPAIMGVFAVDVTHTNSDTDEATVQAIFETAYAPVGISDYGERMEQRTTVTLAKSTGAVVTDTLTYAGTVTDDDPYPDDVVWSLAQLISDDGYLMQFAIRQVTS